jgi:hypothetical protein
MAPETSRLERSCFTIEARNKTSHAGTDHEIALLPQSHCQSRYSVPRDTQLLDDRRHGDLLMQISQTLDERLALFSMASVKLLDEAHSDCVRARPAHHRSQLAP